jgi:hypothetical protein
MNVWARHGACHRAGHFGPDPLAPSTTLRLLEITRSVEIGNEPDLFWLPP